MLDVNWVLIGYLKRHENTPNMLQNLVYMDPTVPLSVEDFVADSSVLRNLLDMPSSSVELIPL